MGEEEAFLRAICDNPEDDTARLVFADWLDDQGGRVNAAWAEFIRVQIALAGGGDTQGQLTARENELWPAMQFDWPARMGFPQGSWGDWSRGFPLSFKDYSGPDVTARFTAARPIPLRTVDLSKAKANEFAHFIQWPGLGTVRELSLWDIDGPFTAGVLALAGCQFFKNLEKLRMISVTMTDEAALAILDSPYLAGLTDLKVHDFNISLSGRVYGRLIDRFGEAWRLF